MVDTFWTTSGRVDDYMFEIVAPNDLGKHVGWLEGVTGGSLTFGYGTELKVSGSLDISTTKFINNCLIRVHYISKLGSVKKDIVLCTCFANTESLKFDKGRYTGSVELRSTLARYIDDVFQTVFTIGKNKSYKSELKRMVKQSAGGQYIINSDVDDKKCSAAIALEANSTIMSGIQTISDKLNGYVTVDESGYMVLEKYLSPGKKDCSYVLPSGSYSVTNCGVTISDNSASVANRVAVNCTCKWKQTVYVKDKNGNKQKYTSGTNKGKYKTKTEEKTKVITGRAQVSSSDYRHYDKRGRWITAVYTAEKNLSAVKLGKSQNFTSVQKEMNKKAASYLSSLSKTKTYEIECFYLPIKFGQVVEFSYIASGIKLNVQAMVTDIEMKLVPGGRMTVKLKHVRYV